MVDQLDKKFARKEIPVEPERPGQAPEQQQEQAPTPEQQESAPSEAASSEKRNLGAEKSGENSPQGGIYGVSDEMQARRKRVEKILEEGLEDVYLNMPPDRQKEFKALGEETVEKISQTLESGKVKAKKIVELIKNWLKIIPGVNKFFLEQEAKIKTDRILKANSEDQKQ